MTKPPRFLQLPWRSRARIARDVDAELAFHLEMRVTELGALGLDPHAARQRAIAEFGDLELTRAYCRRVDQRADTATRLADSVHEWRQDTRYAVRTLRRGPGFAAVSLATLAIAIGANTAVFSVTRGVLLAPLPYGDGERLVALSENWPGHPADHTPMSPANFVDYRAKQRTFTDLAAYATNGLAGLVWQPEAGDPTAIRGLAVTANLFDVLRVRPIAGRTFTLGEGRPGDDNVAIVSYHFFEHELGGDAGFVGRRIRLSGESYELAGVMPRGFTLGADEDVWLPLDLSPALADPVRARRQRSLHVIGRLRPGVPVDMARADLRSVARRLEAQYPDANTGRFALLVPLHEFLTGGLAHPLLLLQGAAAMVLLIACANLANLMLARTMGRRRELALRAALGAGRARLARQLLAESMVLAIVGGVLGVAIAFAGVRALLGVNPDALPQMFAASIDGRVLLFSLGLAALTGVLFGVAPAFAAASADLHYSIKSGGERAVGSRASERVRGTLVVAQVALAVMLLVAAGLLIRSFDALVRANVGYDASHVLTARVTAAGERYDSAAAANAFFDELADGVARSPGVVAVGATTLLPTLGHYGTSIRVEGQPVDEANAPDIGFISIRGDYFKALSIPVIAGRAFNASDVPGGVKTVIINDAGAKRFFPNGNAVGQRIRIGPDPNAPPLTIVGVVGNVRDEGSDVLAKPLLYENHRQETWERSLDVVIRTTGDPESALPVLRRVMRGIDPGLALRNVETLDGVVAASQARRRFSLVLTASFAGTALLLAALGIYGVLSHLVTMRTREFGVRLALGATARSILLLVLRQGFAWSLAGVFVGVVGAIAAHRLLAGLVYGVTSLDVATYAEVIGCLLVAAGIACLTPARRATRADPLASMRAE